jgi:hypothetical protein
MAAGGRRTVTQHGLCVVSIVSIIWHNVLKRSHEVDSLLVNEYES